MSSTAAVPDAEPVASVSQTATLVTLNASSSLAALHRHSVSSTALSLPLEEKLNRAQLMRETGLKCIGFIGIPKVSRNVLMSQHCCFTEVASMPS